MNDDIEKRINALLDRGKKLLTRIKIYEGELNYWCDENDIPEFQAWLASAVNILNVAATPDSFFQKECTRLVSHDNLVKSGALPAIKAKRAKSYAAVRNKALHAQWDDFDIRDVGEVINGTRELVEGFL